VLAVAEFSDDIHFELYSRVYFGKNVYFSLDFSMSNSQLSMVANQHHVNGTNFTVGALEYVEDKRDLS